MPTVSLIVAVIAHLAQAHPQMTDEQIAQAVDTAIKLPDYVDNKLNVDYLGALFIVRVLRAAIHGS